jgi:ABC-type nickel/cobalt efflux system permease component RcnA
VPGPLRRLAILAVALTLALGVAQAADPFTGRGAPSETGASAGPAFAGGLMLRLANAQRELNDAISAAFREVRDRNSATAILLILGLAFLYGVLHALGPGHGKAVVASYFVANRARWSQGIAMGSLISLIQGAAAIVMVGLLAVLLQWQQFDVLDRATLVEFVSYGLIAALGLVMFYRAITGKGHDHGLGAGHAHEAHEHGDSRDLHDHGRRHAHDHAVHARVHEHGTEAVLVRPAPAGAMALGASSLAHGAAPAAPPKLDARLIVAAGLTPCASAIIILLFALANQAFGVGVAAVAALSVGMALTVSAIGVLSVLGRHVLLRVLDTVGMQSHRFEQALAILGSALIVVAAGLLMMGAWVRL